MQSKGSWFSIMRRLTRTPGQSGKAARTVCDAPMARQTQGEAAGAATRSLAAPDPTATRWISTGLQVVDVRTRSTAAQVGIRQARPAGGTRLAWLGRVRRGPACCSSRSADDSDGRLVPTGAGRQRRGRAPSLGQACLNQPFPYPAPDMGAGVSTQRRGKYRADCWPSPEDGPRRRGDSGPGGGAAVDPNEPALLPEAARGRPDPRKPRGDGPTPGPPGDPRPRGGGAA